MENENPENDLETLIADDKYVRGFNSGYQASVFLPQLVTALDKVDSHDPWFIGFKDGNKQFDFEKSIERLPPSLWTDRDLANDFNQSLDKDLDKDGFEPED